ncbi:endo-1,4-beta-mannosidase [Bacteroidia bacterium]|nr:endo-1,4-beta-mannosidase [Bacteroidia bacterium]GHT27211.1 endo-1,4-beta-mannosidase [Bacteroidia bacterium]
MKKTMHKLILAILFLGLLSGYSYGQTNPSKGDFIKVVNGQFIRNGNPYYYIGTNFWYGPIIGSVSQYGNRDRLIKELDFMKANGINNLRVLVGAEGPENIKNRIMPTLQKEPGVYEDYLWDGLDFFMNELGKRDMTAVLFLTNNWDWSGGYMQYLTWAKAGTKAGDGSADWMNVSRNVGDFYNCEECLKMLKKHISVVVNRVNKYTGKKYTEDPNILSWQIANEPRPMRADKKSFEKVLKDITAYIKSVDPNHLVSTGSEGEMGSGNDYEVFEAIHTDPNVDYVNIHMWPKNWRWLNEKDIAGSVANIFIKTDDYLDKHLAIAARLKKPLVMEEFGLPRDHHLYVLTDPTTSRDAYFAHVFSKLLSSRKNNSYFAGCNFWAWGGFARPSDDDVIWWQIGDDYMGDPAMEEQGLNSVFDTDSTIGVIKKYAEEIK